VIKTKKDHGVADICVLPNGLKITKNHPILHKGEWIYPSEIIKSVSTPCDFVYNLVVDDSHIAIINNTPLILLGHNYTTGILNHPYLGTKKVIEDLSTMPGFHPGLVELNDGCLLKSKLARNYKIIYNGPEFQKLKSVS